MIETIRLLPGVTLRCRADRRFHQGCLSAQFITPMEQSTAAMNALLPSVLLRGSRNYPDLRAITLRLDDLYGAGVGELVRRIGDYQTTGLSCSFMEDRFALPGDRVLEPMARFLGELLLDPCREKGRFREDYVAGERKNLISTIDSQRNDKRVYAMGRLMELMGSADSFGIPRLGTREQAAAITPEGLWDHYQGILSTAPLELFYVGSAPAEEVAGLLGDIFSSVSRNAAPLPPQTPFRDGGRQDVTEEMDLAQAKLSLGFTTPITNRSAQFAAMEVANNLYGGGMTSKLFLNVREKMSLCYAIGSAYYGTKGLMTVSAGVDGENVDVAKKEILAQLDACRRGDITDGELTGAKEAILSTLRAVYDSPGAIEGYYSTAHLSGLDRTPEEYARQVEAVTREDAARAAGTLALHTTYLLKGGNP